jgi:hypothetical protein
LIPFDNPDRFGRHNANVTDVIRSRIEPRSQPAEDVATLWKSGVFSTLRGVPVAAGKPPYDASLMTFADPSELRRIAHRIETRAAHARSTATRLRTAVQASGWRGPAADAFHLQVHGIMGLHHTASDQLERAARALRRHADIVETELAVVRAAKDLISAAAHVVGL